MSSSNGMIEVKMEVVDHRTKIEDPYSIIKLDISTLLEHRSTSQQAKELVSAIYRIQQQAAELTKSLNAEAATSFADQWEFARARARQARDARDKYKAEEGLYLGAENDAGNVYRSKVAALNALESARPKDQDYPSASEVKAHAASVERSKAEVAKALETVQSTSADVRHYYGDLQRKNNEFRAAQDAEIEVRNKLKALQTA